MTRLRSARSAGSGWLRREGTWRHRHGRAHDQGRTGIRDDRLADRAEWILLCRRGPVAPNAIASCSVSSSLMTSAGSPVAGHETVDAIIERAVAEQLIQRWRMASVGVTWSSVTLPPRARARRSPLSPQGRRTCRRGPERARAARARRAPSRPRCRRAAARSTSSMVVPSRSQPGRRHRGMGRSSGRSPATASCMACHPCRATVTSVRTCPLPRAPN